MSAIKSILALLCAAALCGKTEGLMPRMGQGCAAIDVRRIGKHIVSSIVGFGIALGAGGEEFLPNVARAGYSDILPEKTESSSTIASTSSASLSNPAWHKAEFNVPSDDFWYPPFMIGNWNADFTFEEAVFSDKVPLDDTSRTNSGGEIPGLSKYSILPLSKAGEDATGVKLRFVQLDSHPREDHSYNLRQLAEGFAQSSKPGIKVDSAPYNYQKAPDWFHSPANRRDVVFHEDGSQDKMKAELFTQKRDISTFAGSVETVEFIRQKLTMPGQAPKTSDYAIDWQFSVPASLRDEFITVDDLRKSDNIIGRLHIFVYLSPSDDQYNSLSGQPVGVYKYTVNMNREVTKKDRGTKNTVYPFIWRDAGPVELQDYFGY